MFQIIRTATILFGLLTFLTGFIYPIAVTVIAQIAFPWAANGSVIDVANNGTAVSERKNGKEGLLRGSDVIGQPFSRAQYFWGRPSATASVPYHGLAGSGTNQSTTNPALVDAVRERILKLRAEDPDNHAPIPVDLVTASASGLDPHISEAAAIYQIARVARVRKIETATVTKLVRSHLERPTLGILGQKRVNVLRLNLALDAQDKGTEAADE
jgi:potassium-transporting ATPase KdpC subunit